MTKKLFVISPDISFMDVLFRQCAGSRLIMTGCHANEELITYKERKLLKLIRYQFGIEQLKYQSFDTHDIMLIDMKAHYQNDKEWREWLQQSYPQLVCEAIEIGTQHDMKIILAQPIAPKLGRIDWFEQHQVFFQHLIKLKLIDQEKMEVLSYQDDNIGDLIKNYT